MPHLPSPRGPLSGHVLGALARPPGAGLPPAPRLGDDPLTGDDLHLALYCCYELHYRGFDGVDPDWEWDPGLLGFRAVLEQAFEAALRAEADRSDAVAPADLGAWLRRFIAEADGPSLSARIGDSGTLEELREFAVHRSAYQLKEADPHTFAIPRVWGGAKSALVEIQADEYGGGRPGQSHAELFAATMRALGLDDRYGAYVDVLPGVTLATCNLVSLFGLHRRLRGALIGHLAVFEMTSVGPMARYAAALRRLGLDDRAAAFYDVHVVADEHHQVLASGPMVGSFAADEPGLVPDVQFGACALPAVEGRFARHLLDSWDGHRSSLLVPSSIAA
jgi:hypothetical protein